MELHRGLLFPECSVSREKLVKLKEAKIEGRKPENWLCQVDRGRGFPEIVSNQ